MKLVSFRIGQEDSFGAVVDGGVIDLKRRLSGRYETLRDALADLDALQRVADGAASDVALDQISFLPVIPNPAKILCVGLNYETHRAETGRAKAAYPTIFTRFADTQTPHEGPIVKPNASDELDFEGELAVVIGKGGRAISQANALRHVAGYACYNDATLRDWQRHGSQFTPGKNFPQTGGFGPWLVTADNMPDLPSASIVTRLNGETMQSARIGELIFPIPVLISYLSSFTPLATGDVISTGTPGGVGFTRTPPVFMKVGDVIEVEISGIGTLVNHVIAEP